ncbi:MAG: hypothetical protein R3B57_03610 [Phycisphaerales bacterium]
MRSVCLATVLTCSALTASPALAQHDDPHAAHHAAQTAKPVNAMCPIGKEPVVESAGTVEYKGATIGLCCESCGPDFLAWSDASKDAFVAAAKAGLDTTHIDNQPDAQPADIAPAMPAPYPLAVCPVSGDKLGEMGDPVVKTYEGREVRFCCDSCIGDFEADMPRYWKKIDEMIVRDQLPYYPVATCIVSGESLTENGEDIAINAVIANRLVRLCCNKCRRKVASDPAAFMAKLDEAAALAQRADYPLDTCVVSGGKLGAMGDPDEIVVAGRLIRLCCPKCEPKVRADPGRYLALVDAAWHDKGMFRPAEDAHHGEHADDDARDGDEHHGHHDD